MKILIVNYEYPPLGGGGGVATKQLAEELAERHEVHVLTTAYKGLAGESEENSVKIHRVKVLGRNDLPTATIISMLCFVPMALWRGISLMRGAGFNVINAQFVVPSGVPAVFLAKIFRVPFIVSFIGGDIYDPTKGISPHRHFILRFVIREISKRAAACTAISLDTKERVKKLHGVTKEIEITHLGLIPSSVPIRTREELGLPQKALLFASIGRLVPRKRYDVLLEAWRDVEDAQLVIIGDGPWMEKLKDMIKKYGLEEKVHLLGFLSESKKMQILKSADGYVSAAEHEGFGIVFLEAMEAGLPIIATNIGGQTDFLKSEENSILVSPNNVKELSTAITRLLNDDGLRSRLAVNNREKVKEFYLDKTVRKFERIMERVAKI